MQANQEILKLQASAAEEAERSAAAVHAQQSLHDEVQTQQQVQALLHHPPPNPPPPPTPPPPPSLPCARSAVFISRILYSEGIVMVKEECRFQHSQHFCGPVTVCCGTSLSHASPLIMRA